MSLTNFKMPKLKFKDMKMKEMEDLGEIDYLKLQKKNAKQKRTTPYEDRTHYKTIKEAFNIQCFFFYNEGKRGRNENVFK